MITEFGRLGTTQELLQYEILKELRKLNEQLGKEQEPTPKRSTKAKTAPKEK